MGEGGYFAVPSHLIRERIAKNLELLDLNTYEYEEREKIESQLLKDTATLTVQTSLEQGNYCSSDL